MNVSSLLAGRSIFPLKSLIYQHIILPDAGSSIFFAILIISEAAVTGIVVEEKKHRCEFEGCTYATNDKSHLTRHKKKHTQEKPFKCNHENCPYQAAQAYDLKVHIRIHTGEKPYACSADGCVYRSRRSDPVQGHIKAVHKGDPSIFVVSEIPSSSKGVTIIPIAAPAPASY